MGGKSLKFSLKGPAKNKNKKLKMNMLSACYHMLLSWLHQYFFKPILRKDITKIFFL